MRVGTGRVFAVGLAATAALMIGHVRADTWKIDSISALPPIPLSDFVQETTGVTVANDHGILLGGIGSDLWHGPGDGPGVYWMLTDRGPNGQIKVSGSNRRTFPVPEFTPTILQVQAHYGTIDILQAIPLTGTDGAPINGLSNTTRDEKPYDCTATTVLPYDANGLDTEGLVRTPDGHFWLADEYSPSILHVDADGRILKRFMPAGLTPPTDPTLYDSVGALPDIYGLRKSNRGFEGLALAPDNRTLFAILQSPLSNPTKAAGDVSRTTRLLAFDTVTESVIAEYAYRLQPSTEFGETEPAEMKLSGVVALDQHRLLVLERTDKVAKLFTVNLRGATNLLETVWDALSTVPSLEQLTDVELANAGVNAVPKELVITLDSASGFPGKIEGVTVLDGRTIAIANDNDFGIGSSDMAKDCELIDSGVKSTIQTIRLDRAIK
jgi:hypothetical protein